MKDLFSEGSGGILSTQMARFDKNMIKSCSALKGQEDEQPDRFTPTEDGLFYRIDMKPGRLLRCSETGIKFRVERPVTIRYKLEYGSEYMDKLEEKKLELVGPLFNIEVKPDVVSCVHLPHYVCIEGLHGDTGSIKCGHFTDGKLNVITPQKIESSYIVLENPKFSCLSPVLSRSFLGKKKPTPIEGSVLLYSRVLGSHKKDRKEFRTHLYLVPNASPQLKELDKIKKTGGFQMMDKPPQTEISLFNKQRYKVRTQHQDATVNPMTLEFKIDCKTGKYPYTEINVIGNVTSISLEVASAESLENPKPVWTAQLTEGDLEELLEKSQKMEEGDPSEKHFVIKYRQDLIREITNIDPVLDALKGILLSEEAYNNGRCNATSQEKMRELYQYVRSWGNDDLDTFLNALKGENSSLIKKLEANV